MNMKRNIVGVRRKVAAALIAFLSMLGLAFAGPLPAAHASSTWAVYNFSVQWHRNPGGSWPNHIVTLTGTYLVLINVNGTSVNIPSNVTDLHINCSPNNWDSNRVDIDGLKFGVGSFDPPTRDLNFQWEPSGEGNVTTCGTANNFTNIFAGQQTSGHSSIAVRYTFNTHYDTGQPDDYGTFTMYYSPPSGGGGGSTTSCAAYNGTNSDGTLLPQDSAGDNCYGYKVGNVTGS